MSDGSGRLITFEGGEGAGKSTQVRLLAERLSQNGIASVATREPGGSPHAEALRDVLLSGFAAPLGPRGEAVLFTAARIDHLDRTILPALANGKFVLCDRFIDSTLAYQGALGHVPGGMIAALERVAIGERRPDLTVLVDVPPNVGLARAAQRRGRREADRFEREDASFHRALRGAFRAIAATESERFLIVDGTDDPQAINDQIWSEVIRRFPVVTERAA